MKFFIKRRLKSFKNKSSVINIDDIKSSKKILFSLFSRYGDGIISLVVIREFINKFPQKDFFVLISRQQLPYAKELLNFKNVKILKVNKRNPFEFFYIVNLLKKEKIDLGFNPWGHGDDSEFFLTYTKKFFFYKSFDNFTKEINLYDRVRKYFLLSIVKEKKIIEPTFEKVKKVLIAPLSTDITKNIDLEGLSSLIIQLKDKFKSVQITLAVPTNFDYSGLDCNIFLFGKSVKNSNNYLKLLKSTDLFIGVDSGPLHLSLALNIPTVGIFGPTSPYTILDNNQLIKILRDIKLKNIFCHIDTCDNPVCIKDIFDKRILDITYCLDRSVRLENKQCFVTKEIVI
jgi:ADP-heptose:LPS heptosyltransferase